MKYYVVFFVLSTIWVVHAKNITFECADGYTQNLPAYTKKWYQQLDKNHTQICKDSPFPECCECIIGQAVCNIEHRGLKGGSFPTYCNNACRNISKGRGKEDNFNKVIQDLKRKNEQGKIPINSFWSKVKSMLEQQGKYIN